ncbi:uncharacterized protein LOC108681573 [Hyalella azteca]|uniref:Uncharacterized protein LOC108681573 n=1 Tax=Hyalella azteca TaxID=294128 RepID=A0A8B7PL43_HYAAZ|nr:uncharacterized protein LOC108681573 [Hyalella azteca]
MDLELYNKYDSIKRKTRTPSYKALLSMQFGSSFTSTKQNKNDEVVSRRKNLNDAYCASKLGHKVKSKVKRTVGQANFSGKPKDLGRPSKKLRTNYIDEVKEVDSITEPKVVKKVDDSICVGLPSFPSECSESALSFDGFSDVEDKFVKKQLEVLEHVNSFRSEGSKSFCGFSTDEFSTSELSEIGGSCYNSEVDEAQKNDSFTLESNEVSRVSNEFNEVTDNFDECCPEQPQTERNASTITFSQKHSDGPKMMKRSKQEPSIDENNSSIKAIDQNLFKEDSLSSKSPKCASAQVVKTQEPIDDAPGAVHSLPHAESGKENYQVNSSTPMVTDKKELISEELKQEIWTTHLSFSKVLKRRANNSKEKHTNLQNALNDALSFFETTMPGVEDNEYKTSFNNKENDAITATNGINSRKVDREKVLISEPVDNIISVKVDYDHPGNVKEIPMNNKDAGHKKIASLQDALSDAVDFFKLTDGEDDEEGKEEFKLPLARLVEHDSSSLPIRKICQNSKPNQSSPRNTLISPENYTTHKINECASQDLDETMFEEAVALLSDSPSTGCVLRHGSKCVSKDSALHLTMSDVITHWLTTGQAKYSSNELNSEPEEILASEANDSDCDAMQSSLFDQNMPDGKMSSEVGAAMQTSVGTKNLSDGRKVNIDHQGIFETQYPNFLEEVSATANCIESVHSFINSSLEMSFSNSEFDLLHQNQPMETIIESQPDTLGAEMHGSPSDVYNCILQLCMDPLAPVPKGALRSLFTNVFLKSPLTLKTECFSSCYERYTELLARAQQYEEKRLVEMDLTAVAAKFGSTKTCVEEERVKRKYTKRKHLKSSPQTNPSKDSICDAPVKESPRRLSSSKCGSVDAEAVKEKRANLRLRLPIPLENYGCLSDEFVMRAEELELPYLLGWRREVVSRQARHSSVSVDTYYYSPEKIKLRSYANILQYFELYEYIRPAKPFLTYHSLHCKLYEYIRPAKPFLGRPAASSRHLSRNLRMRSMDYVSDFDFLGFMEEDSLLDFEGFSTDQKTLEAKRIKLDESADFDYDLHGTSINHFMELDESFDVDVKDELLNSLMNETANYSDHHLLLHENTTFGDHHSMNEATTHEESPSLINEAMSYERRPSFVDEEPRDRKEALNTHADFQMLEGNCEGSPEAIGRKTASEHLELEKAGHSDEDEAPVHKVSNHTTNERSVASPTAAFHKEVNSKSQLVSAVECVDGCEDESNKVLMGTRDFEDGDCEENSDGSEADDEVEAFDDEFVEAEKYFEDSAASDLEGTADDDEYLKKLVEKDTVDTASYDLEETVEGKLDETENNPENFQGASSIKSTANYCSEASVHYADSPLELTKHQGEELFLNEQDERTKSNETSRGGLQVLSAQKITSVPEATLSTFQSIKAPHGKEEEATTRNMDGHSMREPLMKMSGLTAEGNFSNACMETSRVGPEVPECIPPVLSNVAVNQCINTPITTLMLLDGLNGDAVAGKTDAVVAGKTDAVVAGKTDAVVAGKTDAVVAGKTDAVVAGKTDAVVAGKTDAAVAGKTDAAVAGKIFTFRLSDFSRVLKK